MSVLHPAPVSYLDPTLKSRKELGISDWLVLLSVGIENTDDILGDIEQALGKQRSASL